MIEQSSPDQQATRALRANKPDLAPLVVGIVVLQVVLLVACGPAFPLTSVPACGMMSGESSPRFGEDHL